MFTTYYNNFATFFVSFVNNLELLVHTFFNATLRTLLGDINLDFAILDFTIAQLVLGAGLITFLTITLVKWIVDIVT